MTTRSLSSTGLDLNNIANVRFQGNGVGYNTHYTQENSNCGEMHGGEPEMVIGNEYLQSVEKSNLSENRSREAALYSNDST